MPESINLLRTRHDPYEDEGGPLLAKAGLCS